MYEKGNNVALSELFEEKGVLHDSSVNKVGQDTIHLEGKMAVDMMFHHRFGFNGGPFQILDVQYQGTKYRLLLYYVSTKIHSVTAIISSVGENGKIKRMNIFPL